MVAFDTKTHLFPFWGIQRFTLFVVPLAQETHSKQGIVTPKTAFWDTGFQFCHMYCCICKWMDARVRVCVCMYIHGHALAHTPTHKSLSQQMPHLSCISELKTTKKIKMIQFDSYLCVRKASRIRQLQQNGEKTVFIPWTGTIFVLWKIKVRKQGHKKYKCIKRWWRSTTFSKK